MDLIQVVRLRTSVPKGEAKERSYHKFFNPPIVAESVQEIFESPEKFLEQIPESERYNVYYTAAKSVVGTRQFIEQDIIPFDIDNIDIDKKEQYIAPICGFLGLDEDEIGVLFSGNGLQIIVGIHKPFTDKKFFEENKEIYSEVCKKLELHLKSYDLKGNVDTSVFSQARLLRFPETINKKPGKQERLAKILRKNILANGFDMKAIAPGTKKKVAKSLEVIRDESKFPKPDTKAVLEGCEFLKYLKKGSHTEPQWYAGLSILGRLENGRALAHEYSKAHVSYSASETDQKLTQALEKSGPRNCSSISSTWNGCGDCEFQGKVSSPISIKASAEISQAPTRQQASPRIEEKAIVQTMLSKYRDFVIKKNGDLFIYQKGVWKHIYDDQLCIFKNEAYELLGPKAKNTQVESAFRSFTNLLEISPVEMFSPNPYMVNFKNGTLHIFPDVNKKWKKEFRPHRKDNYLINQLSFDYDSNDKSENTDFLEMLDRVFEQDEDKKEKIFCIQQMYGACLAPAFPHLFLLHGGAGTGKTTVILPLHKFLQEENIARVEPHQFTGFYMESMAGKLVNIVTDIETKKPMEDANIKKVEDRVPVRIDRKFKKAIYAPLPAIHIFGANEIPATLEGASKAHERRWTLIEFKSFKASGLWDKNFAENVFKKNPMGILNFALRGLDSLLESGGHFHNPPSGQEAIKQWLLDSDVIQQFLNAIQDMDVLPLIASPNGRIHRGLFYDHFKIWCETSGRGRFYPMNNNTFFRALRQKGCLEVKSMGNRYFAGFEIKNM